MRWQDFLGRHRGQTAYVCGLGESWTTHLRGRKATTFGVNDCGRNFDPEYLVCVDDMQKFSLERWMHIERSKAGYVFSQLKLPIVAPDRVVKISVNDNMGSFLHDPLIIDISYSSTFVAMNVAYWMGFSVIALCGTDFTGHHLEIHQPEILGHIRDFADNAAKTGCRVLSIVEDSPNNQVLEYVRPEDI